MVLLAVVLFPFFLLAIGDTFRPEVVCANEDAQNLQDVDCSVSHESEAVIAGG